MIKKLKDMSLKNKILFIRQDLNVPLKDGKITSNTRILASLASIKFALEQGAGVILASHLGRPKEGEFSAEFSLQPVADELSNLLNMQVELVKDYLDTPINVKAGEVKLLENVRFNLGEKGNSDELAQKYAALCDIFVMDAFATAHRAQASTHGVAKFAKQSCAGILLSAELDALETALQAPKKPLVAIVGGSKVSTKLEVLNALIEKCDTLIPGGGIANTFLASSGLNVGKSLYEAEQIDMAKKLLASGKIVLPTDVVVSKTFEGENIRALPADKVEAEDMILDIGKNSVQELSKIIEQAQTILWNGPVGVFENDSFAQGTQGISEAIANSAGFSIAGGGDTLAAIEKFTISDKISYISTGGGAFLEFVEGKVLPALEVLDK